MSEVAVKPRIHPQYQCPVCSVMHPTEQSAVACRDQIDPELYSPGSIVAINLGYSWFDGDPEWVVGDDKNPEINTERRLSFLFVVTSSQPRNVDPHHRVYSVRTLAISNGIKGGLRGWTVPRSHYTPHAIDPALIPDSVRQQAAQFVGEQYDRLL